MASIPQQIAALEKHVQVQAALIEQHRSDISILFREVSENKAAADAQIEKLSTDLFNAVGSLSVQLGAVVQFLEETLEYNPGGLSTPEDVFDVEIFGETET